MAAPSSGAPYSGLPRFPNFKVHKLLGKGSYGKVYKVERDSDKQLYALKEADLGSMSHAERADAVNEVRLLVSISHHNVIRYHEAFLLGNKLCTVMEYAPFGDLRYYISKGAKLKAPFPEEAIWRILLQLCRGLQALHSQNIIHRDIKPANIFLCANDLLKIGDLGIAKALTNINFARTQIGTPCYMAPDKYRLRGGKNVWSGRPYSYSSDMWSMGAVLYEMMTFRTPMEGQSIMDLRNRIMCGRFAPVASGRYSQELISLCHNLLSTEPPKRPSPGAILSSYAASKWLHVLPEPPAVQRPPARRWTSDGSAKGNLLDTIVVPRDLKQLPKRLPPPSYDSDAVQPVVAAAAPVVYRAPPSCSGPAPSVKPPVAMPVARPVPKVASGPGSRISSRENSRAPSPAEARSILDNRKGALGQVALPPHIPRVPGPGLSSASAAAAAAAAAAIAAYQQRWAPSAQPVVFNSPRVLPYRRVSIS